MAPTASGHDRGEVVGGQHALKQAAGEPKAVADVGHYVRCLEDLFRCTDYIPVPSASRAGPLKSGTSVRRA